MSIITSVMDMSTFTPLTTMIQQTSLKGLD